MEQLEHENRHCRWLVSTMALVVLAIARISGVRKAEDELVVKRLVVQDNEGRNRIVMASDEGGTFIRHYDAGEKIRIAIATMEDGGASIEHYDAGGDKRLASGTSANDQAFVQHYDMKHKLRIVSGTMPEGKVAIQHHDGNEKKRIITATLPDGNAVTAWWNLDADGNTRMVKVFP